MTRPTRNYTSTMNLDAIFGGIHRELAAHKARKITFDYDDHGRASAIQFTLELDGKEYTFHLPARIASVRNLVANSYESTRRTSHRGRLSKEQLDDQAQRTAWKNIAAWIEAQMTLIDSGMVRTEEVFLPYLLVERNTTMFEAFEQQRALPQPSSTRIEEIR